MPLIHQPTDFDRTNDDDLYPPPQTAELRLRDDRETLIETVSMQVNPLEGDSFTDETGTSKYTIVKVEDRAQVAESESGTPDPSPAAARWTVWVKSAETKSS